MIVKKQGSLIVVICFLLCHVNTAYAQTVGLTPQTILKKMIAKYASASSYQDSGILRVFPSEPMDTGISSISPAQSVSSKDDILVSFKTYFQRPRMFRFEWQSSLFQASRDSVIWSDGKQLYSLSPRRNLENSGFLLQKQTDMKLLIDETIRPSGGTVYSVPSLLMEDLSNYTFADVISNMSELSLLGEKQFDAELCYVIQGKVSGVPWMLWVGKKSHLLRKTRTLYSRSSFHDTLEKGAAKTLMAEEIHRDIRINERIPEKVFEYKPQLQTHDVDLTR